MPLNKLVKELKKICLESENITPMVTLWGLPPTHKSAHKLNIPPSPSPLPVGQEAKHSGGEAQEAKHSRPLGLSSFRARALVEGRGEGKGEGKLNKLAEEVKVCQKCPLGKTRIQAVFGVGNPSARIIFIGEGPGYEEDRRGEPFVGKAGKLLDKILASINLSRLPSPGMETIYIANVVKCHPMVNPKQPDLRGNDRPPTQAEAMSCFPYLLRQIEIINPQIICPLGNAAAKVILGTSQGISSIRGKFFEFYHPQLGRNIQVLPTYHPAALLRNPNLKKEVWEDMKLLKRQLQSSLSSLSSLG